MGKIVPDRLQNLEKELEQTYPEICSEIRHFFRYTLPSFHKKGYLLQELSEDFLRNLFRLLNDGLVRREMLIVISREYLDCREDLRDAEKILQPFSGQANLNLEQVINETFQYNPAPSKRSLNSQLNCWMGIIQRRYRGYLDSKLLYQRLKQLLLSNQDRRINDRKKELG